MSSSSSGAFRFRAETAPEWPVKLIFPVTWSYLSDYASQKKAQSALPKETRSRLAPVAPVPIPVAVVETNVPPQPEARPQIPADGARDQWEMVVPKMSRPAARAAAPPSAPSPGVQWRVESNPLQEPEISADMAFTVDVGRSSQRIPTTAIVAAVLVVASGLFYVGARAVSSASTPAGAGVQPGAELPIGVLGWTTETQWPRHLTFLRASAGLKDFRLEFKGTIETRALGWVIRAKDAMNYYAMKLEIATPGRDPVVVLKRFAVIGGRDQDVVQVPLPTTFRLDTLYKVRVDVLGDRISTWVQDRKIDEWTDTRLSEGSIGLFNEYSERGAVKGDLTAYALVRP
jgi:hypothetical protein